MSKIIVIGGGFGGIASALRMKAKGFEVKLIDRCHKLGGRAQVFERGGFKHDAGPTIITAPYLIEELYQLFNLKLSDYLKIVPLDPWYQFQFNDNTIFDYSSSLKETLKSIKNINSKDCEGYKKLLNHSKSIYDIAFLELAEQPFHKFSFMLKQIPNLIKLGSNKSVYSMVSKYLKNDKLRKAFSIQPLLVGGNPFTTTSIYGLIHYLERCHGIHFVMGGTGKLVKELERLMLKVGIEIYLDTTIVNLKTKNNKIISALDSVGKTHYADYYISNIDPIHLYTKLLTNKEISFSTRLKTTFSEQSMGLFVLYFGTTKKYKKVKHHTIIFGNEYKKLLNQIFTKKQMPNDFSIYLHRPTATDSSFAPKNCDSFYALVPVPNLSSNIDWIKEGELFKDKVIKRLEERTLPNLRSTIQSDFFMTPLDFKNDYLAFQGSGFSIAPYFNQSAWFRFHNKSESFVNLFLAGAGSHPGAGLPGVISSAKVLDKIIKF